MIGVDLSFVSVVVVHLEHIRAPALYPVAVLGVIASLCSFPELHQTKTLSMYCSRFKRAKLEAVQLSIEGRLARHLNQKGFISLGTHYCKAALVNVLHFYYVTCSIVIV